MNVSMCHFNMSCAEMTGGIQMNSKTCCLEFSECKHVSFQHKPR